MLDRKVFVSDLMHIPVDLLNDGILAHMKADLLYQKSSYSKYADPQAPFEAWSYRRDKQGRKWISVPRFYGAKQIWSGVLKDVELVDLRVTPKITGESKFTGSLGVPPYDQRQTAFHRDVVAGLLENDFGGFGVAYCGSGKTAMCSSILAAMGLRTLVVVNKNTLADQWRETLKAMVTVDGKPPRVGSIQGKKIEYGENFPVSISTIQSLSRKEYPKDMYSAFGLVILDEAHHCPAETYFSAMSQIRAKYLLGVTATLRRSDGMASLFSHMIGPALYTMKRTQVAAKVYYIRFPWSGPSIGPSTPMHIINDEVSCNLERNRRIIAELEKAASAGRNILVLSALREHLNILMQMLPAELKKVAGFYTGDTPRPLLAENKEKCQILLGTKAMADEGLDIKRLDTLILTTPIADVEQAAGRILRPYENKKLPVIVDFVDQVPRLVKMASKRDALYRREGMNVKVPFSD